MTGSGRARRLAAVAGLGLLAGGLAPGGPARDAPTPGRIAGALRPGRAAAAEPAPLDTLREHLLALLQVDGALRLRVTGVELHGRDGVYRVELTGEKTSGGTATLAAALAPAGQAPALRLEARATADGRGGVDLRVDVAGEPSRLGAAWPEALPAPSSLATRAAVRLPPGGAATATGQLTLGAADPVVADFTARYDGATFEGDVDAGAVSTGPLWRALGLGVPPVDAGVRAVRVRVTGRSDARTVSTALAASLGGIEAPDLGVARLDGTLEGTVQLVRGDAGLVPGPVERALLTVIHGGARVGTIAARSRGTTPWPLDVEAQVPDAAAAAPVFPGIVALAGSGRLAGQADRADGALRFQGVLDAEVPSAELRLGAPAVVTALRAAGVPVHWNAGGADAPGSLTIARLETRGLVVDHVTSSATLIDGLLRLPDVQYRHYGGHGHGWVELALAGHDARVRARVEGAGVDLAAVVRGTGATVAQVTGRAGYTASLQQRHGRGLDAVAQVRSEQGGEIGIEAIEGLLASGAVEVESTGLLRQTLENLRVFEYESLAGELRAADGQGTVDLSITGRRRLGLFPGPVQAINFRNVPLDVLVSALDRGIAR